MDNKDKAKLRLALSIMSGRVKPENLSPEQWEIDLGLGYYRPDIERIMEKCEDIVFEAVTHSV